jgi:para-aminobenzoate synthetase component 1
VLLRSALVDPVRGRYSLVGARPFLTFRSFGSRCELIVSKATRVQFGNPWQILELLLARYELIDTVDLPFPLGGCFGFWGYELKRFVEPRMAERVCREVDLPDAQVGFYRSLVVFDHCLGNVWIVSTGLTVEGSHQVRLAQEDLEYWRRRLKTEPVPESASATHRVGGATTNGMSANQSRSGFVSRIEQARRYIQAGDIYQVNLSQRFSGPLETSSWQLFRDLTDVSPAPFAAYLDGSSFQLASSSPELFLRMSGSHIRTRPIKGTRPRSIEPTRDAQLSYELQSSPKELAELVMITDLLRNDLGKICEYGSIQVPELVCLERYAQVQHLVSTIEGRLREGVSHLQALAACFPGGSITGAPKMRAMEIIDELEPVARGPYTGALGYLGFNRESQLSILIRTAGCANQVVYLQTGAGIVADSVPEAEYEETLAKAQGFFEALRRGNASSRLTSNAASARR